MVLFQHAEGVEGGYTDVVPVDCWSERDSSDEEPHKPHGEGGEEDRCVAGEVFDDENPRLHPGSAVELAPRAEPVLHGMVRNRTEPNRPLAFLTPVTGPTTWI